MKKLLLCQLIMVLLMISCGGDDNQNFLYRNGACLEQNICEQSKRVDCFGSFFEGQSCNKINKQGACVLNNGGCNDNVRTSECGTFDNFYKEKKCNQVDPKGACVKHDGGCQDNIRKSECKYLSLNEFHDGSTCSNVDPKGRCIHKNTSTCSFVRESECNLFFNTFESSWWTSC